MNRLITEAWAALHSLLASRPDTPFLQVASADELETISRLRLHLDDDNEQNCSALHYAAAGHKAALVQQLLELGADPDIPGGPGENLLTPLHLACLGRVQDQAQLAELFRAADDVYDDLQVI